MNLKRFTARNSREALRLVRDALGDDAVVLSTKPTATGVEVLAMAAGSLGDLEATTPFESTAPTSRIAAEATMRAVADAAQRATAEAAARPAADLAATSADEDAERLSMSTLSFQDYVRKRMLKRRQASRESAPVAAPAVPAAATPNAATIGTRIDMRLDDDESFAPEAVAPRAEAARSAAAPASDAETAHSLADAPESAAFEAAAALRSDIDLLSELRAVKGLIEERFGVLAFMEKLQRHPAEARLAQKLLDCGFSPMLVRKMADGFKADAGDETEWAAQVLERNL